MAKFISLITTAGNDCLINTDHILCVLDKTENSGVSVVLDQNIAGDHNCMEVNDLYKKVLEKILE